MLNRDMIWYRLRIIQAIQYARSCKKLGRVGGYEAAMETVSVYRLCVLNIMALPGH